MQWFVIFATDIPGTLEQRMEARPNHVARLNQLLVEGRLLIAGPSPSEKKPEEILGSTIIAKFENILEAKQWASEDPYVLSGVYQTVEVRAFTPVIGSAHH